MTIIQLGREDYISKLDAIGAAAKPRCEAAFEHNKGECAKFKQLGCTAMDMKRIAELSDATTVGLTLDEYDWFEKALYESGAIEDLG
jgi:hypothetical protein